MSRALLTVLLLLISNVFMTLAWYGHLQVHRVGWLRHAGLLAVILLSWGLAFFEYLFQVPANRLGSRLTGGPYGLFELKLLQEVISIGVFTLITLFVFRTDQLRWNHVVGFGCLLLAVVFVFKKW
ncbi:MAG: DMT family protein [Bacteroidia bacterium]|nr:DMT family protein [Bacteroidia bacterium]